MSGVATMSSLVESYLTCRRQAGFQLTIEGQQLFRFATYADGVGHQGPLNRELAVAWATLPALGREPTSLTSARRIEVLRGFAHYHQQFEPDTEIPPRLLFGSGHRRLRPHIYTNTEIVDLLDACESLHPAGGLRGASCRAVFGLLAATGMRVSEATGLTRSDVDLETGLLEIRDAKFGKSRWVPVHPTAAHALRRYAALRDAASSPSYDDRFFIGDHGRRCTTQTVQYAFKLLRSRLGWISRGDHVNPRIHDIRHTFICRTLQRWYEDGSDIDSHMLSLSTYVGHAKVTNTYWYVTATPELMSIAAQRFISLTAEEKTP